MKNIFLIKNSILKFLYKFYFSLFILLLTSIFTFKILYPVFISNEIIITYGIHPFDICSANPSLWKYLKISYIIFFFFSNLIISNFIFNKFFKRFLFPLFSHSQQDIKKNLNNLNNLNYSLNLQITIGKEPISEEIITIPESGLYQNFLITGTIGSGKTASAMYPFTRQLLEYNYNNPNDKIGMLILDVKGNYHSQVKKYAKQFNLEKDLFIIELHSNIFYNPLHKPNLNPQVLANRLKTILTLFSENNSESYWLDKAEQVLAEAIKLCRLYNNGYVTFLELHKLITIPNYYEEKINILRNLFVSSKFNHKQIYELNASLNFFQKEFLALDSRTKAILISEITRITNTFISDFDVFSCFCPPKDKLNFLGFNDIISNGKIVVLNMNISKYSSLSKIIATYLKLDFQSEILNSLSKKNIKKTAFICDEYDKYCTKTDSDFFSLSREAKCINIISTQSYSSLKNILKDEASVKVIIQNLINKIWFRTDDIFTIEETQKQLGKEEKEKTSTTISENAKETHFNYITNTLCSKDSNISESYNSYYQTDYIYDTNFFTQRLETFSALTFLSDGNKIYIPKKLQLFPYFK